MKKILSVMSLVLVSIMLVAVLAVGVFANENPNGGTAIGNGAYKYTVDGYKTATPNGSIVDGEYSKTLTFTEKVAVSSETTKSFKTINPEYADDTRLAESVSISFAHDATKIYIGVVGKGATTGSDNGQMRDGYQLRLGFDPAHPEYYIGLDLLEIADNMQVDPNDPSKTIEHDALSMSYAYSFAKYMGIWKSNGDAGSFVAHHANGIKYVEGTAYPITAMKVVKQSVNDTDGDGTLDAIDIRSGSSHGRTHNQVYTYWEIELDKATLLNFFNSMYTEGGVADLNTMLFAVSQYYGLSDNGYVPQSMWNGSFGDTTAEGVTHAMQVYNYDQVVFGAAACAHTDITPATCTTPAKCSACGETDLGEGVAQAALGHDWQKLDDAVAATCTTAGKTQKDECKRDGCDATQGGTTVKATGHKWVAGEGTLAKYCDNENCDAQITVAVTQVEGYTVGGVSVDGVINSGEYTETLTYTKDDIVVYTNYPVDNSVTSAPDHTSTSVSLNLAHTANKIYLGIDDLSGTGYPTGQTSKRTGYVLRIGFDPAHPENYVGLYVQCIHLVVDSNDSTKSLPSNMLAEEGYDYPQAEYRGLFLSNGNYKWAANDKSTGVLKYTTPENIAKYPITAMTTIISTVDGSDLVLDGAHGKVKNSQYRTQFEMEIDKELMLAFFNEMYKDEGETPITSLDTMMIAVQTADNATSGQNVLWNGTMHEDYAIDYAAKQTSWLESYGFDKVVFSAPTGCQHTNITPATCTQPAKCADCGETELGANSAAALGHDWQKLEDAVAAGCTTEGKTQKDECGRSGCGATQGGTPVKATGHSWAVGEGTVAKYCTVDGCDTEINVAVTTVNGYAYKGTVAADGTIGATEYTESVDYNDPKYYVDFKGCGTTLTGNASAATYHQQEVSVSFAHNADKIYVGIYDLSGTEASMRNEYVLRFGFDPAHPENYIGLFVGNLNMTAVSGDSTKVEVNNMLKADDPNDQWDYPQAGVYGLAVSHGETWWNPLNLDGKEDGIPRVFYNAETAATYPITAMKMVKEAVTGDFTKSNYDATCVHKTYFEIEIDKELMLDFFNQMYDEDKGETPITNLNTMLFSVQTAERKKAGENVMWNGTYGDDYEIVEYSCNTYGFDRVNFIDCPHTEWDDATCAAPKTCKACGETDGVALEHADVNPKDHVCDNGCNVPQGEHADGDDKNHTCDYCGGTVDGDVCVDTTPKDHVCDECGANVGEHADGDDNNHTCDYCGGTVDGETCTDENPKDHVCDECGETVGEHADGDDNNHTCDYCGGAVDGDVCVDTTPKDHVCDECGAANMGEHADSNDNDHTCDYCGGAVDGEVCADVAEPKDHLCDECGETISVHTGGTATCEAKAVCTICGEEYGDFGDHAWVDADCTTPKTCSVCEDTDGAALGHAWNIVGKKATCTRTGCGVSCQHEFEAGATNCKHCNIEKAVIDACEHVWLPATCTSPEVCDECGNAKPDSVALGHDTADVDNDHICDRENCNVKVSNCQGGTATCEAKAVCTICGEEYGDFAAHTWVAADCDTPKTCSVCEATEGAALGHTWVAADCDTPKTCSVCQATEGEALGHTWVDADCDTPKTCSVCQATEGEALGHTWVDADCDTAKTCSVCQATEGEALGHDYNIVGKKATCTVCQAVCVHAFDDGATNCKHCNIEKAVVEACDHVWILATCTSPKICDECGITEGTALGHTEVVDAAVAATCTTAGLTEGKHCSVCNTVLVAQTEVAALGHTEVVDAAVAATCTTAGLTEGKHCSVCNTVTVAQTEVAALGHAYDDDNDATCNTCGDVREVETESSTTAPSTTDAPTTDAPTTDAPATEAPTTEAPAEEKGCGGSVGIAGLALVAALGTCTVFVAKKKED